MLSKTVEEALNEQVGVEMNASNYYLSMASWCNVNGFEGASAFLYQHSEEERQHMLRLFHYINDAGGHALAPALNVVPHSFNSLHAVFEMILEHEIKVTDSINKLVDLCYAEKDHSTTNFLQWYVAEQHEEEKLMRTILDKFKLIGDDKRALFWIDREIAGLAAASAAAEKE